MKKFIIGISAILILAVSGFRMFSPRTIQGIVSDAAEHQPLAGVIVKVKDTKIFVSTDKAGRYAIQLPDGKSTLVFSFIGFDTKEAKVGTTDRLNISLDANSKKLSEVIVVGFASPKISEAASAVTIVGKATSGAVSELSSSKDEEVLISKGSHEGSSYGNPQSRQLTAGEWNDLSNWKFWKELMNNQDWSEKQSYWSFYTKNKIGVQIINKDQKPIPGLVVSLKSGDDELWKSITNYEGKAILWPSLYSNSQTNLVLEIKDEDGNIIKKQDLNDNQRDIRFVLDQKAKTIKKLDILFMVDATGSMGDEINYLKSELKDIISRIDSDNTLETRLGMVFYRDRGDEYLLRNFDFRADISKVQTDLSQQSAGGGGDFEEAVEEAMESSISQQRWTEGLSAKIMFMILDAPPHHDQQRIKSIQRSVKAASEKGIVLIPVVASGIDKNTEFLMRFLAMSTNGTYVFLTDHSGIGNSHLKPTVGSYKVEYLNNLMLKLIRRYAGLNNKMEKDMLTLSEKDH